MTHDAKDLSRLTVYRGTQKVGILERISRGARFTYKPEWVEKGASANQCVAFSMPIRKEPYDVLGTNLHPFFAGLLPEGLRMKALLRGIKTSEDDLFSMLVATGEQTVGDVWGKSDPEAPVAQEWPLAVSHWHQVRFRELLEQLLDWSAKPDRAAIAGVEAKISDSRLSLPLRGKKGRFEYLLKFGRPELSRSIENEFFFMKMARSMRLSVAHVELLHDAEGQAGLLVRRFDRQPAPDGSAEACTRLHQEDACQLLDVYPSEKYRLQLGQVLDALEVCSAPMVERLRLIQWQALSYLIGNGDLHGKNISVQVANGRTALTPIYDLLSTLPYGDEHMALKVAGRDKRIRRGDFLALGESLGVRSQATGQAIDHLLHGIGKHLPRLFEIGLDPRKQRWLERTIEQRLGELSPKLGSR